MDTVSNGSPIAGFLNGTPMPRPGNCAFWSQSTYRSVAMRPDTWKNYVSDPQPDSRNSRNYRYESFETGARCEGKGCHRGWPPTRHFQQNRSKGMYPSMQSLENIGRDDVR